MFNKFISRADLPNLVKRISPSGNIEINGIIIKSNGFIVGYPKVIYLDKTSQGNVGVSVTNVAIVPVNLLTNNDFFDYQAQFDLAANGNSKSLIFRFDSQAPTAVDWANTLSGVSLVARVKVYRTTSTTIRAYTEVSLPTSGGSDSFTSFADRTVGNMDSNTLNFVAALSGTSNNDIVSRSAQISVTVGE